MLHLIRNNSPYTVIILFIFTLICKLPALSHPVAPVVLPGHFMYGAVVWLLDFVLSGGAFAYTMLSVILLFAQGLYLNNIATRRRLFAKPMYNVAFVYIILTSVSPVFSSFSKMLLVNWLLLAAIDILLGIHQTAQPRKNIFNAGFLLSLAALIYFPAILYLLLLVMALVTLRSFNAGEWVVGFMGFITPIYFAGSVLFIADQFSIMLSWPAWHLRLPGKDMHVSLHTIGAISGIVILLFCGAAALSAQMGKTSVFTRRNWSLVAMSIFLSAIMALTTINGIKGVWLTAMPVLSLVIAQPLYSEKNKRFSNFIFYFSLIFVIFCQLALNK